MRHPQSQLRAFMAWKKNPTPETQAQWREENRKILRREAVEQFVLLCALGMTTAGIVKTVGTLKNRSGHQK